MGDHPREETVMTKKERIRAAVELRRPDRLPYAMWTHLPGIDLDPVALADATYDFYKTYDVDLIKTMNNGMYAVQDFGCEVDFSEIAKGGVAKIVTTPVMEPEDWGKLKSVGTDAPALARELRSLELLLDKVKGEEVPVIFTVFSPLTTADKLSNGKLLSHIEAGAGELVHQALEVITQTTCNLVRRAIALGADGVYFATQLSNYGKCPEEVYREYGVPYDRRVLEASEGWCDVIHAHGDNIMFELLKDYPVDIFNWHAWESLPKLKEASVVTGKCIMGGLKRMDITNGNKNEIRTQIYESLAQLGGVGQILAPGCVIRYPLNDEMLRFVSQAKKEMETYF